MTSDKQKFSISMEMETVVQFIGGIKSSLKKQSLREFKIGEGGQKGPTFGFKINKS